MNALHHWAHVGLACLLAIFHKKLGIDPEHVKFVNLLQGLSMLLTEFPGLRAKLKAYLGTAQQAVGAVLVAVLALALGGCSLTPQQIETDTAVSTNLLLNGATILDKAKAPEIKSDAVQVAQYVNAAVIPAFQPGANAGQLTSATVAQVMPHLQVKLSTLKHGPEIIAIISLLQGPLSSALGATASPTALLSPTAQMNALAFFSGVSQGISTFAGDATLIPPPLPSTPLIPTPAPASPAPASTTPK